VPGGLHVASHRPHGYLSGRGHRLAGPGTSLASIGAATLTPLSARYQIGITPAGRQRGEQ